MRFRKLRIAWSVVWGLLAVLLIVLTACRQQPTQMAGGFRPDTNWKGTLADLLPPIDDIQSITLTSDAANVGDPPVTRNLQDSERGLLIDSLANTHAVLVDFKYEISGDATIVSRKGKAVRLWLFNIASTHLVYLIRSADNVGPGPYFIQSGDITRVLDLLPNSLLQKGKQK